MQILAKTMWQLKEIKLPQKYKYILDVSRKAPFALVIFFRHKSVNPQLYQDLRLDNSAIICTIIPHFVKYDKTIP